MLSVIPSPDALVGTRDLSKPCAGHDLECHEGTVRGDERFLVARRLAPRNDRKNMKKGFGLIEIIVAIAIASMVFFSIYELIAAATRLISDNAKKTEAVFVAEEGLEAVLSIRNNGWSAGIAPLAAETAYYPTLEGSTWTLSATNPGPVQSVFTRTVTFHTVYRDANDDISANGTADLNTRRVTVRVTWNQRGQIRSVELETYLTNFLDN